MEKQRETNVPWVDIEAEIRQAVALLEPNNAKEKKATVERILASYGINTPLMRRAFYQHIREENQRRKKVERINAFKRFGSRTHFTYVQLRSAKHDHSKGDPGNPLVKLKAVLPALPMPSVCQVRFPEHERDSFVQTELFETSPIKHYPSAACIIRQAELKFPGARSNFAENLRITLNLHGIVGKHRMELISRIKVILNTIEKRRKKAESRQEAKNKKREPFQGIADEVHKKFESVRREQQHNQSGAT